MFKKFAIILLIVCSLAMSSGCAYEKAYVQYAQSQADMARAAGPMITFHSDGRVASIGNPMVPMAMMQMKAPKSEWESLTEWMKMATPFAAIWGIVGSLGGGTHNSTSVSGSGNFVGNQAGNQSQWASPTTTTTTTETVMSGAE